MAAESLSGIEDALDGLIGPGESWSKRDRSKNSSDNKRKGRDPSSQPKNRDERQSDSPETPPESPSKQSPEPKNSPDLKDVERTTPSVAPKTPTGRPPGRKTGEGPLKARATVWVEAELINEYRQRVWEERCQLGELIERALREYQQRHWNSE